MRRTKSRLITILMVFAMLITALPTSSYAATTKSMTTYNKFYKRGNIIYCNCDIGIYKVNLSTAKVTRLQSLDYDEDNAGKMKYKNGYLYYFFCGTNVDDSLLKRVKVSTGKRNILARRVTGSYVISGKNIYYKIYKGYSEKILKRKMRLNGKSKKSTSNKIKCNSKSSNVSGYSYSIKSTYGNKYKNEYGEYFIPKTIKYYLNTPSGSKIYLGKTTIEEWVE